MCLLLILFSTACIKLVTASICHPLGITKLEIETNLSFGAFLAGEWEPEQIMPVTYGVQFLTPYIISWALRLGLDLRIILYINVISNIITGLLVYALVSTLYGRRAGVIACGLISFNWHYWFWSNTMLPEGPLVALMTGSTLLFLIGVEKDKRAHLWGAGTLLALAFLAKYSAIILLLVFLAYVILTKGLKYLTDVRFYEFLCFFFLPLVGWCIYDIRALGINPLDMLMGNLRIGGFSLYLLSGIWRLLGYIVKIPAMLTLPPCIFALLGFALALKSKKNEDLLPILWLLLFLVAFSLMTPSVYGHYMVHWSIPLVMFSAKGLDYLFKVVTRRELSFLIILFCMFATYNVQPFPFYQGELKPAHMKILMMSTLLTGKTADLYYRIMNYRLYLRFLVEDILLIASFIAPLIVYSILRKIV